MENVQKTTSLFDSICQSLEQAWLTRKTGERPTLELQLERHGEVLDSFLPTEKSKLLVSLIQFEIELLRRNGHTPLPDDYVERFPDIPRESIEDLLTLPALPPPVPAEQQLPPRYQMIEEVGRGGIGNVWRVMDTKMNRPLAVKMLHQRFRSSEVANARLKREAILTGSLQHPGIPPVHDHGTMLSGSEFFTMKLVEGQTLAEILQNRKHEQHDLPFLISTFEQIAQTMAYAHSQEVIHRDIKPQNVMVGKFGEVQIMDWGLATELSKPAENSLPKTDKGSDISGNRFEDEAIRDPDTVLQSLDSSLAMNPSQHGMMTRQGDVIGTPAYMPPEQARGEVHALGPASDVFGLGAILFEILTESRLYAEANSEQIMARAAAADLDASLSRLEGSGADRQLIELCKSCLHADSEQRPQHAGVVAQTVTDYLASVQSRLRDVEIERASELAKKAEAKKRRLVTRVMVSALMVSLIGGIAGMAWQWQKTSAALTESNRNFELAKEQTELANQQREIATKQSNLSLATLADVVRNYQDVFDSTKYEKTLSEEGELARKKMLTTAMDGLKQISTRLKEHPDYSASLIIAHMDLGAVYLTIGGENYEDARDLALAEYESALQVANRFYTAEPDDIYAGRLYAQCMESIGGHAFLSDDHAKAIKWLNQAIALEEELWEKRPSSKAVPQDIFHMRFSVGTTEFRACHLDEALEQYEKAIDVVEVARSRDVEILDEYERDVVFPELKKRITIIKHLPSVRKDPNVAFEYSEEMAPRMLYDCARWFLSEGDHASAFGILNKMDEIKTLRGNNFYDRACGYAKCLKALNADQPEGELTDEALETVRSYTSAVITSLKAAKKGGYFDDPTSIALMARDPDLDIVRGEKDFQEFFDGLRQ